MDITPNGKDFSLKAFSARYQGSYEEIISAFFELPTVVPVNDLNAKSYATLKANLWTKVSEMSRRYPEMKNSMPMFLRAMFFAQMQHLKVKQSRKTANGVLVDYIFHPIEVMSRLELSLRNIDLSFTFIDEAMSAAVLHDVVEDTVIPRDYELMYEIITELFSANVSSIVRRLTNHPSINSYKLYGEEHFDKNTVLYSRRQRKIIDFERLRAGSLLEQLIKLLDMESNTATINTFSESFQPIYRSEMVELFSVLDKLDTHPQTKELKKNIGEFMRQQGINIPYPSI